MQNQTISPNLNQGPTESVEPWYKQFWPWFLIGLPLAIIIACGVTVYLAIVNPLNMVKQDYYKEGLTINKNLRQLALAEELGISLDGKIAEGQVLHVSLKAKESIQYPKALSLHFIHPLNSDQDRVLLLQPTSASMGEGSYLIAMQDKDVQDILSVRRWYIQVAPNSESAEPAWALKQEINIHSPMSFRLSAIHE